MWTPTISQRPGPRYLAIAEALSEAVELGDLLPGDKLPTHRALATQLSVTVGTVTRAYAEARRRGLIMGEVGRGSFIKERPAEADYFMGTKREWNVAIPMHQNYPVPQPDAEKEVLSSVLRQIGGRHDLSDIVNPTWFDLENRIKPLGVSWFRRLGTDPDPECVFAALGFQSSIWAVLSLLTQPGDLVLAESVTTPGLKALAAHLHLRMRAVAIDEDGIIPDSLEALCRQFSPKVLYCTPTVHTPTTATTTEERRHRIAEIAKRYHIHIIEDDDNTPLVESPPPSLYRLAPDWCFSISDVSRPVCTGIRLSFILSPPEMIDKLRLSVASTTWLMPAVVIEMMRQLMEKGGVDKLIDGKRRELRARHALVADQLRTARVQHNPLGHHAWLHLPRPWRSEVFVAEAEKRGVALNTAETFAVEKGTAPNAVRLCVGALPSRSLLNQALETIRDLLHDKPGFVTPVV